MRNLVVLLGAFLKMSHQVLTPRGTFLTNDNPTNQSYSVLSDNIWNAGAF
jgi:hypothetical protein